MTSSTTIGRQDPLPPLNPEETHWVLGELQRLAGKLTQQSGTRTLELANRVEPPGKTGAAINMVLALLQALIASIQREGCEPALMCHRLSWLANTKGVSGHQLLDVIERVEAGEVASMIVYHDPSKKNRGHRNEVVFTGRARMTGLLGAAMAS